MIKFLKKQRATSVLGLSLEGNRLEAVVLRRTNGSIQPKETLVTPWELNALNNDPEAVGRELRKQLDAAGIRERNCAVCLPLSWVLTVPAQLPELPEEDIASFLQLEAERGFPSGYENLQMANSRSRAPGGGQHVTMMAVPQEHLNNLERALKAAQLKAQTYSLGITALEADTEASGAGEMKLRLGSSSLDLLVSAGGGVLVLRSLDGAVEGADTSKGIDLEFVARELRITLGQLPPAFGEAVRTIKVFGPAELVRNFISGITPRTAPLGLKYEFMGKVSSAQFVPPVPTALALSPALALGANWLRRNVSVPEFLPPKVHPWQQFFTSKYASKRLAWAGAAAGGLLLLVGGAFLIQQWQLSRWTSRWEAIAPDVAVVEDAQQHIRRYRPWFDESFRALRVLRKLTEAFPEDGMVTVKTVEIRDLTAVTCSGIARDRQSVLKVIEKLGNTKEISELNPESLRGQAPTVQFTFNFQWEGDTSSGN